MGTPNQAIRRTTKQSGGQTHSSKKNGEVAGTWAAPSGCSYQPTGDLNLNNYRFMESKLA